MLISNQEFTPYVVIFVPGRKCHVICSDTFFHPLLLVVLCRNHVHKMPGRDIEYYNCHLLEGNMSKYV